MTASERAYPDRLEIQPLVRAPVATIRVPGSKSITNRALIMAALACTESEATITGALRSEDTEHMIGCLERLGFIVRCDWATSTVSCRRPGGAGIIPFPSANLYTGNSGTTMRFVAAMAALGQGTYRLDGDARMRERPIGDLADALSQMGAAIHWEGSAGFPPIRVESTGLNGGRVTVRGEVSSQFLSALLLAAPYARDHTRIVVEGALVSKPYVRMTLDLLRTLGKADIRSDDELRTIWIRGKQRFPAGLTIPVEPDASAASYFFAAAAIAGGTIQVCGLSERHLQGDVRFAWVLKDMGCEVRVDGEGITVYGGPLRGIDVDMNAISDTVMTLAAVACFASRSTTIRNVAHIRHKETDRIAALATELRRVGMAVDEFADGLRIDPRPAHGAEIETYNDHRMAMSMALVGLRVPGIVITNPGCVAKTYPAFWRDFAQMRM